MGNGPRVTCQTLRGTWGEGGWMTLLNLSRIKDCAGLVNQYLPSIHTLYIVLKSFPRIFTPERLKHWCLRGRLGKVKLRATFFAFYNYKLPVLISHKLIPRHFSRMGYWQWVYVLNQWAICYWYFKWKNSFPIEYSIFKIKAVFSLSVNT